MALFRTGTARNNLNDWLNQNPGNGSDNYSAAINAALANAANRQTAAQRYNTGEDPNIQANRTNYRLMAQRAAENAAAGTKALAGGYDASYADSAAAQGYQTLMEGQHDAEAQLRQLAMEGMRAEDSQADILTSALLGAQQLEMNANQMAQDRYQMQRDFLTNEVTQAQAEQDNFWSNVWNSLVWAANVALKTYDNYKGYSQQQWENDFAQQRWEAEMAQRALENERYNTEYADSRADTAWSQGITEQELALEQLAAQDDHAYTALQMQKLQQDMQRAAASAASGGSGGSYSSGLSVSDFDKLASGFQEATMMGDDVTAALYAAALQSYGGISVGNETPAPAVADLDISSGISLARSGIQQGWTGNEIVQYLIQRGYSDDMIAEIMNKVR